MPFEHRCEVCGRVETLTSSEAFDRGWDYPPRMGAWGVVSPRTCGKCPISGTLWWAIAMEGLDTSDPLDWPEGRRQTLAQILSEQDGEG